MKRAMADIHTIPAIELFHSIADAGSAAARQLFVERDLGGKVRLRNVYYPEVQADLTAHGGRGTPALWDGTRLVQGDAEVLAFLRAL